MRSSLFTLLLALLIPLVAIADDQPAQIRVSALDKTPIAAGPLKIRITRLRASFLKVGSGSIEVEVENVATGFETFSPHRLSLINKDNIQINVAGSKRGGYYRSLPPYDPRIPGGPLDRRIAPGARVKESYSLSGKVHFPIRLYYDEKLLAEVIEGP
ncbi:MAG: hypothetical protein WAV20_08905 [Blastocatellia bacterium]